MTVNLDALNGSGYVHHSSSIGAREVHRYILGDSSTGIERAVGSITSLLTDNPQLIPTFARDPGTLRETAQENPYLVINGKVLCLCALPQASSQFPLRLTDRFFSQAVLQEPVKCTQGHLLEKRFAEHWACQRAGVCPSEEDHQIGNIRVNADAREEVDQSRQQEDQQRQREAMIEARLQRTDEELQRAQLMNIGAQQALSTYQVNRGIEITGACAKILLKGGTYLIIKGLTIGNKVILKGTIKTGTATAKKIPILGLFLGLGLGVYRLTQGEYVRAAGEVISGGAACYPGPGTAVAIGMDLAMAAYDIYETTQGELVVDISIDRAHQTLGIPFNSGNPPTRGEIDAALRAQSTLVHPDRLAHLGVYTAEQATQLQQMLNGSADILRAHYGYA